MKTGIVGLGVVGTNTLKPMNITSWSRNFGTGGAYGRIVVFNETHLQYSHHENPTDKVLLSLVWTPERVTPASLKTIRAPARI